MSDAFKEDIEKACEVLRQGGVILYPTDTVWGIGCDATNAEAVERVYRIKQRDDSKALVILLGDRRDLWRYVDDVPEIAEQLLDVTVRPTTIIYDHARNIARNAVAEDGSVAIRVTDESFSRALCRRFRRPLVSTSANISGKPTPATFSRIPDEIKQQVDYIVEARRNDTTPARPSIIMKISSDSTFKIIRK
ncbi:MAG: threonylcarbamoyl-AMP synthase [Muribaculaceae bacterium]|nr:threonylcarbamoyl-AMP synthase [Muribaculaceae bacterium]